MDGGIDGWRDGLGERMRGRNGKGDERDEGDVELIAR